MQDIERLLPPYREPLPKTDLLLLTQALTWIIGGRARTDRELEQDRDEQTKRNIAEWHSPDGPLWLLPILESISNNAPSKRGSKAAKKWLKQRGIEPDTGLALVQDAVVAKDRKIEREQVFQRLLFHGCRREKFTLYGLRHHDNHSRENEEYVPIRASYFMRNPHLSAGKGYFGLGELSSVPESDDEVLESVFGTSVEADRSPVYRAVKISREDAELLRDEVDHELRELARQEIERHIQECSITPSQGEAECMRLGLAPIKVPVDPKAFDPNKPDDWSFVMAIAWIASHDLDVVRRCMDAYVSQTTYWAEHRTPDPAHPGKSRRSMHLLSSPRSNGSFFDLQMAACVDWDFQLTPDAAKEELWRKLQDGELVADGIEPATGKRTKIPGLEFKDLQIISHRRQEDHLASTATPTSIFEPAYLKPLLRRNDVFRIWPNEGDATPNTPIGTTHVAAAVGSQSIKINTAHTKPSFTKIANAIQAEEEATGKPLPPLLPGERFARLSARMKAQGFKASEIPNERTFRDFFNKGPGKSAKGG